MLQRLNLTGRKFNMLTAIKYFGKDERGKTTWLFKCDCGNETVKVATLVNRGIVKSCGCLSRNKNCGKGASASDRKTHGMSNTRMHHIWLGMKYRCSEHHGAAQKRYSERGISICDEWMKFECFYEWAITNGYDENLTIDRIDNDGNYEPSKCRWVTRKEQNNNRSSNHKITYLGETKGIYEWSKELGIHPQYIYRYIAKGYTDKQAIEHFKEKKVAEGLCE